MMRIVFVDDDTQILEGLRRMLFARRDVWQMRFFADPVVALEDLSRLPADLVISDLQMPDMDGAAFLDQVRQRYPQTVRYVLTGVLDHPLLGQTIRCAHQVIAKPCRPKQLQEVIERAEQVRLRLMELDNIAAFSGLNGLPVMPEAHQRVLDMLGSPQASPRRLGQLVAEDVGMSARIVQMANSAYFGRPGKVHDPIQAVLFLGIRTVEAMVLTEGVFARLAPELVTAFGISALQSHCLRVGVLARRICSDLQFLPEQIESASTAGILHDAGKIALISVMTDTFSEALSQSRRRRKPLFEVERELIGVSHAELAGAMLQLWAMPVQIIEATACHHLPDRAVEESENAHLPTLSEVIFLADAIDHTLCSSRVDGPASQVDLLRLEELGLTRRFEKWVAQHTELFRKDISDVCQAA